MLKHLEQIEGLMKETRRAFGSAHHNLGTMGAHRLNPAACANSR